MKAFKVVLTLEEKAGFTEEDFKSAIVANLAEYNLKLLSFQYQKDSYTETRGLLKTYSVCECLIEMTSFGSEFPFHQIVLGTIQTIPQEYPYIEFYTVVPSVVEI